MDNDIVIGGDLPVEVIAGDNLTFYTNAASINASIYDFEFFLFNQSIVGSENKILRKELCKIFMSPQHAKAFHSLLSEYIKIYEEKFGNIVVSQSSND